MTKKLLLTFVLSIFIAGHCFSANQISFNRKYSATINDTTTVSFSVNGTSACKANIEAAVTAKTGVISASWDAASKTITIIYLESAADKKDFYAALAVAGYDNAELRAKKPAYDALSQACQYTRDPETE